MRFRFSHDKRRAQHHQIPIYAIGLTIIRPKDESMVLGMRDKFLGILLGNGKGRLRTFICHEFDTRNVTQARNGSYVF